MPMTILSSVVSPNPLAPVTTALDGYTPAASEDHIYCASYYQDALEYHAGACWERVTAGLPGGYASGLRKDGAGNWWRLAEAEIDPCMLGARNSDLTTDSYKACQEAHDIAAPSGLNSNPFYPTGRKVVYHPPMETRWTNAAPKKGCYNVSHELQIVTGLHVYVMEGATIQCIVDPDPSSPDHNTYSSWIVLLNTSGTPVRSFNGDSADNYKAVFGSSTGSIYQAIGAKVQIDGYIDGGLNLTTGVVLADVGVYARVGQNWMISAAGGVLNCKVAGVKIGSPNRAINPTNVIIENFRATAPYTNTWANRLSSPASVAGSAGVWMSAYCSDNYVNSAIVTGYQYGYHDQGADNNVNIFHCNTYGSTGTNSVYHGPMLVGFLLEGTFGSLINIFADTITTMQTGGGTLCYGLQFGVGAKMYNVKDLKVGLNVNDFSTPTQYDTGTGIAVNNLATFVVSGQTVYGPNSIDGIELVATNQAGSGSTQLQYNTIFAGNVTQLQRKNVRWNPGYAMSALVLNGIGDMVLNRENLFGSTSLQVQREHVLGNPSWCLWTRYGGTQPSTSGTQFASGVYPATPGTGPVDIGNQTAGGRFNVWDEWYYASSALQSAGVRTVDKYIATAAQLNGADVQTDHLLRFKQTAAATGTCSLLHRRDRNVVMMYAGKLCAFSFVHQCISGTSFTTGAMVIQLRITYGTGSSNPDVFPAVISPVANTSANLIRTDPIFIQMPPLPSPLDIRSDAYLEFKINYPTGALDLVHGAIDFHVGIETGYYDSPDPYQSIVSAHRFYNKMTVYVPTTGVWVSFPTTMANIPFMNILPTSTPGITFSGISQDGVFITATTAGTYTFEANGGVPGTPVS